MQFLKAKAKKAQYGYDAIEGIIMSLVVAGIMLGVGLFTLQEVRDQLTAGTVAYNAVNDTIVAIGGISGWFGILIAIGVVAIILSVLFFVRGRIIGGGER